MLLFFIDLINIENLRISFRFFYSLSFLILLFFVAELLHIHYLFFILNSSYIKYNNMVKNGII